MCVLDIDKAGDFGHEACAWVDGETHAGVHGSSGHLTDSLTLNLFEIQG
jgi:hypothetical protein